jgi:clan AA aspartic protease (TIGR02281 family)
LCSPGLNGLAPRLSPKMNRYFLLFAAGIAASVALVDLESVSDRAAESAKHTPRGKSRGGDVVLQRAGDGHFYVEVDVNGSSVRMLADTGASAVVLSTEDAERAGIDVDQLDFTFAVSTANGQAAAAQLELDEVRVGSIVRRDVRAIVTRGLPVSLLGMSFFNSLSTVAMESDELVLRD